MAKESCSNHREADHQGEHDKEGKHANHLSEDGTLQDLDGPAIRNANRRARFA